MTDAKDHKNLLEFLDEEIAVRKSSASPSTTDDEAKGIAEANWARWTTGKLIAENEGFCEFAWQFRMSAAGAEQLDVSGMSPEQAIRAVWDIKLADWNELYVENQRLTAELAECRKDTARLDKMEANDAK